MKVVVTIPAYNEEETIAGVVKAIQGVMKRSGYEFALLVVNDGSSDRTAELARAAGAVVVSHPRNRGLAEAFRTEMRECLRLGARVIVHTDADNQYGAKDIPRLIRKLNSGYDLVLG
ncbi:glycosyl transferase, partial [Candidatus Woesearchaeota archaeon CG10_big_fil_rev_8_21_14_0_10_47_5]